MNKLLHLILNLSLFILVIIVSILIMELVLRAFPIYEDAFSVGDKDIGFKYIPNKTGQYYEDEDGIGPIQIQINSEGFRDYNHDVINTKNKYRIAVIGDSFVSANQIRFENTFPMQLEEELGIDYEVFNFGVNGFSVGQNYLTYKYYIKKYHPDKIILLLSPDDAIDNCCEDSWKPCFYLDDGQVKQKEFEYKIHNKFALFIADKFKVIVVLRKRLSQLKVSLISRMPFKGDNVNVYETEKPFLAEYDEEMKGCTDLTLEILKELNEELKEDNVSFFVVLLNHPALDYEKNLESFLKKSPNYKKELFDFRKPNKLYIKFFEENEIDYVDIRLNESEKYYFVSNHHLNSKGYKEIVDILKEEDMKNYLKCY